MFCPGGCNNRRDRPHLGVFDGPDERCVLQRCTESTRLAGHHRLHSRDHIDHFTRERREAKSLCRSIEDQAVPVRDDVVG